MTLIEHPGFLSITSAQKINRFTKKMEPGSDKNFNIIEHMIKWNLNLGRVNFVD